MPLIGWTKVPWFLVISYPALKGRAINKIIDSKKIQLRKIYEQQ